MSKFRIRSLRWKLALQIVAAVAVAVAGLTYLAIATSTSNQKKAVYDAMRNVAADKASDSDADVQRILAIGSTLARLAEGDSTRDRQAVVNQERTLVAGTPDVLGAYTNFAPNAFDGRDAQFVDAPGSNKSGRFTPYWNRLSGKLTLSSVADADVDGAPYYETPKRTGKPSVLEPYLYNGVLMASYTTPIYRGGKFVGIGGADRSLNSIDGDVKKFHVLDTGYAFYVSNTGIFVSAPDKKLIGKQTLTGLAKAKKNPALAKVAAAVKAGRTGHIEATDPFTGKDVVLFYSPVKTGNWSMVIVAPKDEIFAPVNHQRNQLLLFGLLALLAISGVVLFIATRFAKPIVEVGEAAEKIAVGDLDVSVEAKSDDEVGRMALAFGRMVDYLRDKARVAGSIAAGDLTANVEKASDRDELAASFEAMTENLRGLVGDIGSTAGSVSAASQQMATTSSEAGRAVEEIAKAVGDVAAGSEKQVRAVGQAQSISEEVVEATRASADDARDTVAAAESARGAADDGVSAVEEVIEAMRNVRESSESATEAIRELGVKSDEIGGIVETISGIAEQTNLLALNAAIEAARAGEQGRGFAVVAEEVRKLAEESQQAAASISTLIGEIQSDTGKAVTVVEDGARVTESGTETVERAREAFSSIGESVRDMGGRVEGIAASIERIADAALRMQGDMADIAAVAEQSSAGAEQVSASTEETSASTQEIAASAQQLAANANDLEELVRRFKIEA
jgi:methyl-accepting chemotaxis protein